MFFDSWHEFWLVIKTSRDLQGSHSSGVMAVLCPAQHWAKHQIDLIKRYSGTTSLTPFAAAASFLTWLKKSIIGKYGKSITRKWKGWEECGWLGCNGNGSLCTFCWPFTETSRESDVQKGHGPPDSKQWGLWVRAFQRIGFCLLLRVAGVEPALFHKAFLQPKQFSFQLWWKSHWSWRKTP